MLDATSSGECFSGLDSVLVLLEFYLMDMEDGVDVRCGRLGLRQISVATSHCKLEPRVTNAMKVRCSQDIYEYALKRMLPNIHWKKCEELLEYVEKMRSVTSFCDKNLSMQMEIQGSSNVKYYNDLELTSDVNGIIHLIGGYFHRGYFHLPPISSVLLERHGLQCILDGKRLVSPENIKTPYCKEGRIDCIYSNCFSGYSKENAIKKYYTCSLAARKSGRLHLWVMYSTWSVGTEEVFIPVGDCISGCVV
ncbi:hypothetical protein V6N11_029117 [Hibiscus sabdariffa]|uniref:Uncharacterized protein n=1 Tax=Hibiscus sabdariffa TaxID=183260 RepID=A0ABR2NRE8_9ROSI